MGDAIWRDKEGEFHLFFMLLFSVDVCVIVVWQVICFVCCDMVIGIYVQKHVIS